LTRSTGASRCSRQSDLPATITSSCIAPRTQDGMAMSAALS
jgi:hypothetical protein